MTGVSEAQGAEPLGQQWMCGMAREMRPETAVKISRNGHMDHLNGSLTLQFFPLRLTLNSKVGVELQITIRGYSSWFWDDSSMRLDSPKHTACKMMFILEKTIF